MDFIYTIKSAMVNFDVHFFFQLLQVSIFLNAVFMSNLVFRYFYTDGVIRSMLFCFNNISLEIPAPF